MIEPTDKIGNITLYNADCMEVMKTFKDKQFDLAIVDPPYGINADINQMRLANKKGFTKNAGTYKQYHQTNWDSEPPKKEYFEELERVSKNQIVWGGNYFFDLHLTGVIVWNKKGSGNFKEGELAKTSINTFKVFNYSRIEAYVRDCDIKIHPTQKPVKLYEWILKNYAKEGDRILDTHFGSLSIGIACEKLGFELTAIELDKDYYQMAKQRLLNFKKQLTIEF